MEFNKNAMLQKYKDLRSTYIEPYEPDISQEGCLVRYAKIPDPCLSSDLCSHRILQHFDAKKALCPRFYKKLPRGANEASYVTAYFNEDGSMHHFEFRMDEKRRYITIRISDQLLVDYHAEYFPGRKPFLTFSSMECTEFDANGRTVSVESFGGNGCLTGGVIISTSSIEGVIGDPILPAYCASKGAVMMLTRELAAEWAKYNITVNAIGPGYFHTEINKNCFYEDYYQDRIRTFCPMERAGREGELNGAVIFLASDASSYVTGHMLMVDGGYTII